MQTQHTERIRVALRWESVRLINGGYRIQNITALTKLPDFAGFKNCTDCDIFVDQLNCVRKSQELDKGTGLWIGLVKFWPSYASVTTLLWDL